MYLKQINPISMSTQVDDLTNTLNNEPLSIQELRKTLYCHGFYEDFGLIAKYYVGFMEVAIRYL